MLLTGTFLLACTSGDLDVGQSVINPFEFQTQSVDSVTIKTSTVFQPDTFVTSTDNNILIGRWIDPQLGQLVGRSFTSVDYTTIDLKDQKQLRLDSLVLELGYAFAYGDTTTAFDLALHQLRQPLLADTYYNSSSVAYVANPLLQQRLVLHPNSGTKQVRFRMPDALAQAFWDALQNGTITDDDGMHSLWPGFAFVSNSTTNAFVGFATGTTSGLRLYYHNTDIDRTATSVQFPISAAHFCQLLGQRAGTPLQLLVSRADQVVSTQTSRSTFVAVGAGLCTRIEFPYLNQFDKPDRFAGLNKALLSIGPIRRSLNDNMPPPAQLALYRTNSQNEFLSILLAGAAGEAQAVASYAYDPTALELTDAYTFDLTQYIGQVIRGQTPNRPLLLSIPSGQSSLRTLIQHVTVGDGQRSTDKLRLRLFITSGA